MFHVGAGKRRPPPNSASSGSGGKKTSTSTAAGVSGRKPGSSTASAYANFMVRHKERIRTTLETPKVSDPREEGMEDADPALQYGGGGGGGGADIDSRVPTDDRDTRVFTEEPDRSPGKSLAAAYFRGQPKQPPHTTATGTSSGGSKMTGGGAPPVVSTVVRDVWKAIGVAADLDEDLLGRFLMRRASADRQELLTDEEHGTLLCMLWWAVHDGITYSVSVLSEVSASQDQEESGDGVDRLLLPSRYQRRRRRDVKSSDKDGSTPPGRPVPARGSPASQKQQQQQDSRGQKTESAFTTTEWLFCLRCAAEIGYRRSEFFLVTPPPTSSSVTSSTVGSGAMELVLFLCWLTRQYSWVKVALHLKADAEFPFMLNYCTSLPPAETQQPAGTPPRGGATASPSDRRQEKPSTLDKFPFAAQWPPASFKEVEMLGFYSDRVRRMEGNIFSSCCDPDVANAKLISMYARQLSVALGNIEATLSNRASEVSSCALHSTASLWLCQRGNKQAYDAVLDGLEFTAGIGAEVSRLLKSVSNLAEAVAAEIRSELSMLSDDAMQKRRALVLEKRISEDEALCDIPKLPAATSNVDEETAGITLIPYLSSFVSSGQLADCQETWTTMKRRHVPTSSASSSSLSAVTSTACEKTLIGIDAKLRRNSDSLFRQIDEELSLRSAMEAEILLLQEQQQTELAEDQVVRDEPSSCPKVLPLPLLCSFVVDESTSTAAATRPAVCDQAYQETAVGVPANGKTTCAALEIARLEQLVTSVAFGGESSDECSLLGDQVGRALGAMSLCALEPLTLATQHRRAQQQRGDSDGDM